MDLHNLVQKGIDWGDTLPYEFKPIWTSHFEIMKETIRNQSNNGFNIEYLKYSDSQKDQIDVCIWRRYNCSFETRRVDDLNLVDNNSSQINYYDWMRKDQKYFPSKPIQTTK